MAEQNERAFQKQPTIFHNKKGGLKPSESRFFCNPGLGFKIPAEAKMGSYIDKKCPFVGKVGGNFFLNRFL
jgi:small subunit ribosomal protein S11e